MCTQRLPHFPKTCLHNHAQEEVKPGQVYSKILICPDFVKKAEFMSYAEFAESRGYKL
jgi:hypothetical protein